MQEGIPGSQADTLQKLDVPVMNIDQCKRVLNSTHRRENVREEKNLCAGGQKGYQYDLNIHHCNDLVILFFFIIKSFCCDFQDVIVVMETQGGH